MLQITSPVDATADQQKLFDELSSDLDGIREARQKLSPDDRENELRIIDSELEIYDELQSYLKSVQRNRQNAIDIANATTELVRQHVRDKYLADYPPDKFPTREAALVAYINSHPAVLGCVDKVSETSHSPEYDAYRNNEQYKLHIVELRKSRELLAQRQREERAREAAQQEQARRKAEEDKIAQQMAEKKYADATKAVFTEAAKRLGLKSK